VRKIQTELFIDAGDADDKRRLFPVLMSLVTGILQCSADEALAIISARLSHMGLRVGTDELLNVDEGLELVERHEREVIKQEKSTLLSEQDDFDQLLADLVTFQETRAGAARASHVVQQPLPAEIRQQDIKRYTPLGSSIWKDNRTEGWRGHFAPFQRVSAPGHRYGSQRECLMQLLRMLWRPYLHVEGLDVAACPFRELFPEAQAGDDMTVAAAALPPVKKAAGSRRRAAASGGPEDAVPTDPPAEQRRGKRKAGADARTPTGQGDNEGGIIALGGVASSSSGPILVVGAAAGHGDTAPPRKRKLWVDDHLPMRMCPMRPIAHSFAMTSTAV
jgi:hypothetical protein